MKSASCKYFCFDWYYIILNVQNQMTVYYLHCLSIQWLLVTFRFVSKNKYHSNTRQRTMCGRKWRGAAGDKLEVPN